MGIAERDYMKRGAKKRFKSKATSGPKLSARLKFRLWLIFHHLFRH